MAGKKESTKKVTEEPLIDPVDMKKLMTPYMIALFSGDKVFIEWKDHLRYSSRDNTVNLGKDIIDNDLLTNSKNNGDGHSKVSMTIDTFATKIASKGLIIATPILPPRTVSFSTDKDNNKNLYSFHPKCKRTIKYNGETYKDIALPSIVMRHRFDPGYRYQMSCVYMVRPANIFEVNKNTMLYRAPFPNIYNDHHVCWGHNEFFNSVHKQKEQDKTWDNLHWTSNLYETFFDSAFNNDLYDTNLGLLILKGINPDNKRPGYFGDLLNVLEKLDIFPDEGFKELDTEAALASYTRRRIGE